jgi:DNA polymerase-3 subunit alpha
VRVINLFTEKARMEKIEGTIKAFKEVKSKKGDVMAFGTLQQSKGNIDLVFFEKAWNECKNFVKVDVNVVLMGKIDNYNAQKPCFKVSGIVYSIE